MDGTRTEPLPSSSAAACIYHFNNNIYADVERLALNLSEYAGEAKAIPSLERALFLALNTKFMALPPLAAWADIW